MLLFVELIVHIFLEKNKKSSLVFHIRVLMIYGIVIKNIF